MNIGIYLGNSQPETGGAFTFQKDIIDSLNGESDGHTYFIFTNYTGSVQYSPDFTIVSTRLAYQSKIYYKFINSLKKTWYFFFKKHSDEKTNLMRLSQKHKIDVMWFMSSTFEDPGAPYIFTVWDLAHKYFPYLPEIIKNGSGFEKRELFYHEALSKAALVITGTDIGKNDIIDFYRIPAERVAVIPFPTPGYILGGSLREVKNPSANIKRDFIFYPAQFWPHKNHIVILYAVKILKEKFNKTIDVVFTGTDQGNLEFILSAAKKLKLADQVHSLGFVKQTELVSLYKHAKMLVFPTYFGPDNLPPLEAFALGCPVVASDISGAAEQLGDAALRFDPSSEKNLAECILALLENEELRESLIAKGLKKSIAWTSSDYKNKMLSLFDELKKVLRLWKEI